MLFHCVGIRGELTLFAILLYGFGCCKSGELLLQHFAITLNVRVCEAILWDLRHYGRSCAHQ